MYFRFPVLLIIIAAVAFGLIYFSIRFTKTNPFIREEDGTEAPVVKPAEELTALRSIRPGQLRAHVAFLASDELEGREAGRRGAQVAARYLASQFQQMGLQPAGEQGSYFQTVPLVARSVSHYSEMRIEINGEYVPLQYQKDFLVVGVPATHRFEVSGELVFTGFGIRAPEFAYDDFQNLNVEGKISVFVTGVPTSKTDDFITRAESSKYASFSTKRQIARDLNAAGVVGATRPDFIEQNSWAAQVRLHSNVEMALETHSKEDKKYFPAVILHPDASELLFANELMPFQGIDSSAAAGRVSPFAMNKSVQMKFITEEKKLPARNVIAYLAGADSVLKSEVVVFTAHFDHLGIGTPVAGDSIYNGAADNASGVAGLLELAEAFTLLPTRPKRSLLFLAVTAEEKGLLGSQFYVEHPVFPLSKTIANINLDVIGIGDSTGLVIYGKNLSSLGEVIEKAAREMGLRIMPDELPGERIFYRSDHYRFSQKGVPAIFPGFGLTAELFEELKQYYHQPSDELDLPFNFHYMAKHVQTVFLAGIWIANADVAPEWRAGSEFENAGVGRGLRMEDRR